MSDKGFLSKRSLNTFPPLSAEFALGQVKTLKELIVLNKWLIWLEQRPIEKGRTTVLIRPWGAPELKPQELTPSPINLRSKIHGYGGGVISAVISKNQLFIAWIEALDGSLWSQSFRISNNQKFKSNQWFFPLSSPICLSSSNDYSLGGGAIDIVHNRWIGIMEKGNKDYLVSFLLNKKNQDPIILYIPVDFLGYISLNPKGNKLTWVEWQQPHMPWDSSQLFWAKICKDGALSSPIIVAGAAKKDDVKHISVFQPFWLSDDQLVVAEDSNGFWNLIVLDQKNSQESLPKWKRLWSIKGDSGMAQWIYGMSVNSSFDQQIVSATCKDGSWELNILGLDASIKKIEQPFDELSYISADKEHFAAVASNSGTFSGLLEIDLKNAHWKHTPVFNPSLIDFHISKPEKIKFKGFKSDETYAWYYPPSNKIYSDLPLLVKAHSGPTSMASKGLDLTIQFWTSRGWAVVDVNYSGSVGFGRVYRDRLKSFWGVADVFDCSAAAQYLINQGKAHEDFIAIEGSSAGGFTTLSCLSSTNIFRAACCKYGVSDLMALGTQTHRFEKGYFDYLIGSIDDSPDLYKMRSPVNQVDKIDCPVIFFQGLKDNVVHPEQTYNMVDLLRKNSVPVELHTYEKEAHGFKDTKVRIDVLEKTELFFRKHLSI